ncbi:MAG: ribosome recycling factor [Candidatus Deferrimicrobium sp.]|nr:ribosome recycling factor [Candidatus Deferrimicrobium sp.]MDO8737630.1 ribosome recycling factor [Candidatus Deferrimicrobium sp.]
MEALVKDTSARMERSIEAYRKELGKVRTGRASFSLLDGVKVDYYGTPTPLQQVGTLSVPESRMITVTPWDTKLIGPIEKAIQGSGLGLNPSSDGKTVRIPIPPLTEERRKELAKVVRKMSEDARVAVRNVRREAIEKLKDREKKKQISEDVVKRGHERIQKETDAHVKKIDEILKSKEQEILEV